MKKIIISLTLLLALAGCSEEIKSFDYYSDNLDEAKEVKTSCEKTHLAKEDQNCINAIKAVENNDIYDHFF